MISDIVFWRRWSLGVLGLKGLGFRGGDWEPEDLECWGLRLQGKA